MSATSIIEAMSSLGGFAGVAGVIASLATLMQSRRTHAQLEPNHGSSVKDQLNRIEDRTREIEGKLGENSERLAVVEHGLDNLADHARRSHAEMWKTIVRQKKTGGKKTR